MDKISWLHRINIGTKDLVLYENYGYRPHIYITNNQVTINDPQQYKSVYYNFINSGKYQVIVKNVKEPFYLNFSESYNTGWKVYLGNFNWVNVLLGKQNAISDKNHFQTDATLNAFLINPEQVCNVHKINNVYKVGNGCVKNADGSYDINMTLFFAPQAYLYLGLIISGTTLVLVVGYLMFEFGRTIYDKRKN